MHETYSKLLNIFSGIAQAIIIGDQALIEQQIARAAASIADAALALTSNYHYLIEIFLIIINIVL